MADENCVMTLSDVDVIISAGTDVANITNGFVILDYGEVTRDAGSDERFIKNVCLIDTLLVFVSVLNVVDYYGNGTLV